MRKTNFDNIKLSRVQLLSKINKEWEFSGGNGVDVEDDRTHHRAYIYQDMTTAIVGKFLKGKLLEGTAQKIVGYRYEK